MEGNLIIESSFSNKKVRFFFIRNFFILFYKSNKKCIQLDNVLSNQPRSPTLLNGPK